MVKVDDLYLIRNLENKLRLIFNKGEVSFSEDFIKVLALEIRGSVFYKFLNFRKLLNRDFDIFLREKKDLFIHPFKVELLELIREVRRILPLSFPNNLVKIDNQLNPIVLNLNTNFMWGLFYSYRYKGFEAFSPLYVVSWCFRKNKI